MPRELRLLRATCLAAPLVLGGLFGLCGCSDKLDTGYVPRPLGVSSTERRGYYASPFTPEAAAAQQSHTDAPGTGAYRRPSMH